MPPVAGRLLGFIVALSLSAAAIAEDPAPAAKPALSKEDLGKLVLLLKSKDRAERLAAARDAKPLQDDGLVAPLAALLGDPDAEIRRAAIDSLGTRESPDSAKRAAAGLGSHLGRLGKKSGSEAEAEIIATADALGALAQPASVEVLLSDMDVASSPEVVKARLMAVANVPAAEAIEGLIAFLGREGRGAKDLHGHHCRAALKWATGESRGIDVDAWRAWWREAKKKFDFKAAAERRAKARAEQADKDRKRDGKAGDAPR